VLDAELARTVVLNEIPSTSIFFFLDPQYDSHESLGLLKGLEYRTLRAYGQSLSTIARYPADSVVHSLEAFIPVLKTKLDSLAEELGHPLAINEDVIWDTANEVTTQLGLRARSELMTPLRHALTGRKVSKKTNLQGLTWQKGPSVPTIMVTLGVKRSLARLEAGLAFARGQLKQPRR